jgi:molybdate transport system ATP-binding protein
MLAATPVPAVLVTHDREEALALGDAVQVLDAGKVTATGLPLDVLGQPGQSEVARLVGVENLLRLTVSARNPRDGTMVCEGGGLLLEAPLRDSRPVHGQSQEEREQVTVGLRSSDIILVSREPEPSSARNRFRGTVVGVELRPPGYEVTLDCGTELRCHITGRALAEMAIVPGQVLWAVFKASSCFLVSEELAGIATPGEPDTGAKA